MYKSHQISILDTRRSPGKTLRNDDVIEGFDEDEDEDDLEDDDDLDDDEK